MSGEDSLHSRERVSEIMNRVPLFGGVPPEQVYTDKLSTWFRGLVKRGHTSAELASDPERFQEAYANPGTRRAYVKSPKAVYGARVIQRDCQRL